MADGVETLSYRELADRLGVSPDAARNRAKRKAQSGAWRIIPGNHPSERVRVQVPSADLVKPAVRRMNVSAQRVPAPSSDHSSRVNEAALKAALELATGRIEQLSELLLQCQAFIVKAQRRVDDKEVALARAEAARERARAEAAERVAQVRAQMVRMQEAHRLEAMELRATEMREMGTKAELERALQDVASLTRLVERYRSRPWWSRLLG